MQIKFRFWREFPSPKMIYPTNGYFIRANDGKVWGIADGTSEFVGLSILPMQFTGLHDKNKKEIYVGDIVVSPLHKHFPYKRVCIVEDRLGSIYLNPIGCTVGDYLVNFKRGNLEVVGNIYEHAHLLNQTSSV